MKKFVETILAGTCGVAALYLVGKLAYKVGHEMGVTEMRYAQMQQALRHNAKDAQEEPAADVVPVEPPKRHPILSGIGKKLSKGSSSVIGRILKNVDDQKVEMYVDGDLLRIDVSPQK